MKKGTQSDTVVHPQSVVTRQGRVERVSRGITVKEHQDYRSTDQERIGHDVETLLIFFHGERPTRLIFGGGSKRR